MSWCPLGEQPADPIVDDTQVATIHTTEMSARELLEVGPNHVAELDEFPTEQPKDPDVQDITTFLSTGKLPDCDQRAKRIAAQASLFVLVKGVLYFLDSKDGDCKWCVVPQQLRETIMEENHSGPIAGHFSGERLYKACHSWWQGMYTVFIKHCASCQQCANVNSSGRVNKPHTCSMCIPNYRV